MLGYWISEFQRAIASGERIFEVLDEPEDDRGAARRDSRFQPEDGHVRFEHVTFGYEPGRPVLHDVDLEVAAGPDDRPDRPHRLGQDDAHRARPALLRRDRGPSPARRSGRARPAASRDLRGAIGIVAQDPFLFSATVRENIAFGGAAATDEEVERAARMAQAHDFIAALPEGYDTVIGERGITLSGGQRQRIAIARAILVDPRVLILDDATASVDATTEAKIRLGLREAMRGRTTLIIAHRLSTISLADEIVVLDHGRVVARGTHGELARDERGLPGDRGARPRARRAS